MEPNSHQVRFIESSHQYFNEINEEYISVTTILGKYEPKFDAEAQAPRTARKLGISVDEVKAMWRDTNKKACDYGTSIHEMMENYIKHGTKIETLNGENVSNLFTSFDDITSYDFLTANKVMSERMLWNDTYKIAGTADLIIDHNDKEFSIGDFKTNKEFHYFSQYGERMLWPLQHLSACSYNVYALQLSLYAMMYSHITGKKCRRNFLMYKNGDKFQYIPTNNMTYEIEALLISTKIKNLENIQKEHE